MKHSDAKFHCFGIDICISYWFMFTAVIYAMFFRNFDYVVIAMAIHEMAHLLVMIAFKVKAERIEMHLGEINIVSDLNRLSMTKQILIYAAGPAINLLSALISAVGKNMDFCNVNLVIGIFQLLPVPVCDGGMILDLISQRSNILRKFANISVFIVSAVLLILGIMALMNNRYDYSLLIASLLILYFSLK